MARFEDTITIHAPVEKVFEFVKDIGKLWACMPGIAVREVVLTPDGVGSHAEWYHKLFGFLHHEGRFDYTEVVPGQRIVGRSSTGPVWTFTFSPRDGETDLTYVSEWSFDTPVVGAPLESITTRMTASDTRPWLENVKAAVEGAVPEPARPRQEKPGTTLTRSVTIDAPVERVFDDVLDIGTFWTGAPDVAVREVKLTPDGVGTTARLYSHIGAIHMEGALEIVEVVRPERISARVHFGVESPLWTFTFEPADGGTRLTGHGEWHMKVPGIGSRLEAMEAKSHVELLDEMLAAAKKRVEEAALVR